MTHGKMVITAQVETFNNLNQYNQIIKCRWPWLLCIVRTIYYFHNATIFPA